MLMALHIPWSISLTRLIPLSPRRTLPTSSGDRQQSSCAGSKRLNLAASTVSETFGNPVYSCPFMLLPMAELILFASLPCRPLPAPATYLGQCTMGMAGAASLHICWACSSLCHGLASGSTIASLHPCLSCFTFWGAGFWCMPIPYVMALMASRGRLGYDKRRCVINMGAESS